MVSTLLVYLITLLQLAHSSPLSPRNEFNSLWYDAGLYGAYVDHEYVSSDHTPPKVKFLHSESCDPGFTFISPRGKSVPKPGPIILDPQGELIWMDDRYGQAMDFRVQQYRGEDYLTFWAGTDSGTHGTGSYYMLNSSYDIVHEMTPCGDLEGDLHEFNIVGDAALVTIYEAIPADLSSIGGPESGWIFDGIFQEIDIETGELLFEWRASDHYRIDETYAALGSNGEDQASAFDFFHINSINKDDEGNYYISSRYMHTITCIRPDGTIRWVLGGRRNDFTDLSFGAATNFSWQHHARWHSGNIITVFDNGAYETKNAERSDRSRGLKIALNLDDMTAVLLQEYINPNNVLSQSQGSVQILPSGNIFVGWGYIAGYTEFTADGDAVCDAHFGAYAMFGFGWVKSYRAFKGDWVGMPQYPPDIAMGFGLRKHTVFVSWNGATEVAYWRLEIAEQPDSSDEEFEEVDTLPKTGFETAVDLVWGKSGFVRMMALDAKMEVLGYTEVLDRSSGQVVSDVDTTDEDGWLPPMGFLVVACVLSTIGFLIWNWKTTAFF